MKKIDSRSVLNSSICNIDINVAKIQEHLKSINGEILLHRKQIFELGQNTTKLRVDQAKWSGGAVVASVLVSVIFGLIIFIIS